MTGVAELSARVRLRVDLGEALRLGNIFGVTADAEMSDIGFLRSQSGRIVGMFGQRAVAGFAVYARMDAFCFGFGYVGVARFAGLMTRVGDWARTNFGERVATIVAIDPEAFWEKDATESEEEDEAESKHGGHAEEMRNVPKLDHGGRRPDITNVRSYSVSAHTSYRA